METFPHGQNGNHALSLVAAASQTGQDDVTIQLQSTMGLIVWEKYGKIQHVATQFVPFMGTFLSGLSGKSAKYHVVAEFKIDQDNATTRFLGTMAQIVREKELKMPCVAQLHVP